MGCRLPALYAGAQSPCLWDGCASDRCPLRCLLTGVEMTGGASEGQGLSLKQGALSPLSAASLSGPHPGVRGLGRKIYIIMEARDTRTDPAIRKPRSNSGQGDNIHVCRSQMELGARGTLQDKDPAPHF